MSRCVSLRVFSSQNSYITSQSETPSATQAIERQRWWEQVLHHFKRTEPSNKLLSLSLSLRLEVEHSYFSKEVGSLNSLSISHFSPCHLSFSCISLSHSLALSLSGCSLLFLCRSVCDCQDCLVAVSSEVVSFNRKADYSDSALLISPPSLSPFALSLALFCHPSTNCCSV